MATYSAPVRDIRFVLNELLAIDNYRNLPGFEDASGDVVDAILDEGAKICESVIFPLNGSGDAEGCRFEDGAVTTPRGFKEAFETYAAGGWIGPGDLWAYVGLVAVLGGVLAGVILIARKFRDTASFLGAVPWLGHDDAQTQPTPYGVAIGLAAVYLFYGNPVFPQAWTLALG